MNRALPFLLLLCGIPAFAADYCVGPSSSGNGSGSDWSNQKAWSDTTVRGDTWYLRAGSNYAAKTFATAVSGTTLITIRKATTNDHVTATGWSDWMGGPAVFTPTIRVNTSYYVFNGGQRDESNPPFSWTNIWNYGFILTNRASTSSDDQQMWITSPSYGSPSTAASHVVVSNLCALGVYSSYPDSAVRRYAMDCATGDDGTIHNNLLFSRMYIYGANQHWFLRQTDGAIVEYSASVACTSRSGGVCNCNHGENVNLYYTSDNAVIRYNWFFNNFTDNPGYSHGGTAIIALTQSDNCKIYGNIFDTFSVGDGVAGFIDGTGSGNLFYNNTVARSIGASASGAVFGASGSAILNNIFMSNAVAPNNVAGTENYNAYSGAESEANGQAALPSSIFVSWSTGDLRLTGHTANGTTLASPYDYDLLGNARGADSVWDRGAFQLELAPPASGAAITISGNVSISGSALLRGTP